MGWLERLAQDSTKLEYDRQQEEALHTQPKRLELEGRKVMGRSGRPCPTVATAPGH